MANNPAKSRHFAARVAQQLAVTAATLLVTTGLLSVSHLANANSSIKPKDLLNPGGSGLTQLQRGQYQQARRALKKGHFKSFNKYLKTLNGYPLKPYLDYENLRRKLYLFPYQEVEAFLQQHQNTYIGDKLDRDWLELLAKQRHWHDYRTYYPTSTIAKGSAELTCYYIQARINTGDAKALEEVETLWNVGKSQPDECDPLFKTWREAGYLTPELAWDRHSKAIDGRKRTLARYIAKQMPVEMQKLAKLYQTVDRYPQKLESVRRFADQTPEMQEIILHGLRRYARRDSLKSLALWERYNASHYFDSEERAYTLEYLITQLARQGNMPQAELLLATAPSASSEELVAWMVRDSLRQQDWQRVYNALQLFSPEEQQSERWLYWRARAMEQLGIDDPAYPTPKQIYASLSLTRSFYGFMAADIVGQDYTLLNRPVDSPVDQVNIVRNLPAMQRAYELLEIGNLRDARREWYYATKDMEPDQLLAAGKLADQWGWHRKTIQAMAAARYWDDLKLRFPLAYQSEVEVASKATHIESPLLFAIARQESAFAADAKSSVGAMGLMQLMPATAKQTARRNGIKYRYWDLIKPEHNIALGSRYLDQLLEQFNGNRVLAAAAYNAGPHRVKQWLAKTDSELPNDVWIETIPFKETRGYVQNVLSYSLIYSYRLGESAPLLQAHELLPPKQSLRNTK
ncbi:transglycosylase SLT domain-containing protein [Aurantivibrio plasticivorans]